MSRRRTIFLIKRESEQEVNKQIQYARLVQESRIPRKYGSRKKQHYLDQEK
jgi:hypothetical protein